MIWPWPGINTEKHMNPGGHWTVTTKRESLIFDDLEYWDYAFPEEIQGCKLIRTCFACPEQYEVFYNDQQIGYLRLRHGYFRADYPDCGDETVYEAYPQGDGVFEDSERESYLTEAVKKLLAKHTGA